MARAQIDKRFWQKVEPSVDGCWLWLGASGALGHGQFWNSDDQRIVGAHRFAYELAYGPIPPGLVIDHLCRNPSCVRPDHLEAVTQAENMRRSSLPQMVARRNGVCKRGHARTPENLYVRANGATQCRPCRVIAESGKRHG